MNGNSSNIGGIIENVTKSENMSSISIRKAITAKEKGSSQQNF